MFKARSQVFKEKANAADENKFLLMRLWEPPDSALLILLLLHPDVQPHALSSSPHMGAAARGYLHHYL